MNHSAGHRTHAQCGRDEATEYGTENADDDGDDDAARVLARMEPLIYSSTVAPASFARV